MILCNLGEVKRFFSLSYSITHQCIRSRGGQALQSLTVLPHLRQPIPRFLGALLIFTMTVTFFSWTMGVLEERQGSVLLDPILKVLGPIPLSTPIFGLTWGIVLLGVLCQTRNLARLTHLAVAYSILEIFRITTIWLVPLNPPVGMIVLDDSISDVFIFGKTYTKDLFFSGHVSAVWLIASYFSRRWLLILRLAAAIIAGMLVAQHVHYSLDVLAAPFFATLAFKIAGKILPIKQTSL